MVHEGQTLAKIADNIVVKIPMLEDGMIAVRRLASEGIRTNVTLCFSSVQCLIAAKAGASYVSPVIARLDEVGQAGMHVTRDAGALGRAPPRRLVASPVARLNGGREGARPRHSGGCAHAAARAPG